MIWLKEQGLIIHGVELYEPAIKDFFIENDLPSPSVTQDVAYTHYASEQIKLSCGDFFELKGSYDYVYDRAALVALPADMRKTYADKINKLLKSGGKCLLMTYEYDQPLMDGPPFSVKTGELRELYGHSFEIELMEARKPKVEGSRMEALPSVEEKIYLLTKR
jgi:thiopurine S-methyltransferase